MAGKRYPAAHRRCTHACAGTHRTIDGDTAASSTHPPATARRGRAAQAVTCDSLCLIASPSGEWRGRGGAIQACLFIQQVNWGSFACSHNSASADPLSRPSRQLHVPFAVQLYQGPGSESAQTPRPLRTATTCAFMPMPCRPCHPRS